VEGACQATARATLATRRFDPKDIHVKKKLKNQIKQPETNGGFPKQPLQWVVVQGCCSQL